MTRAGDCLRLAVVTLGVVASLATHGDVTPRPPIIGSAPTHGDIVSPGLINRAMQEEAIQKKLPRDQVARAARSVEIVLQNPLVLSTFNPFVADDDLTVTDSRYPGQERPILAYLDHGLPGGVPMRRSPSGEPPLRARGARATASTTRPTAAAT